MDLIGGYMKYTSHMEKRMRQRGFTKNMVDVLYDFGDSELNTHKVLLNKGNIALFYEKLRNLEIDRELLCKRMRELSKKN